MNNIRPGTALPWIMLYERKPEHGQLIVGRNSEHKAWVEVIDSKEPYGNMVAWVPVADSYTF